MIKQLIYITSLVIFSISANAERYVFYLHGKIVEDQGANAVETVQGFGAYEYSNILETFRKEGFVVISEVRARNTDPATYAHKVARQVDSLIKKGVRPNEITVIGASKGSVIAMLTSSTLKNKDVNFVFMAGCFGGDHDIRFCGNILSIYEQSDGVGSCQVLKSSSSLPIPHYKEITLHTGLRHGFLYKPLKEWVIPAVKWANGNYN